ncbi:MAG: AsmA-like C-terminal region-containing protein, partial [Planctomycetota bacterium]
GGIRGERVTIEMNESGVRLSGEAAFDRLPFGPPLALLLPARLGGFFEQGATSGSLTARLKHFDLGIGWPPVAGRPALESLSFDGTVRLEECEIRRPVSLQGIDAKLDISGSGSLSGTPSVRFSGRLRDLGARLGAFQLSGLEADLAVDEQSVELSRISGQFLSGRLAEDRNQVRIGFGDKVQVSGQMGFEQADLGALLTRLGQSQRNVGGKVSLAFDFAGDASSLASLTGSGQVVIVDGQLWELPILATLYTASLGLVFGSEGKPAFDRGIITFGLSHGKLIVDRFELNAPVASSPVGLMLTGRGVLGPTGVDLRVVPRIIAVDVPILSPAIELLKSGLLNYRIYGPLANPRIAYWNAAADVMSPNQDVTRLPRLAPRFPADWNRRF